MLKIAKKIVYLQKIASACRVSKAQRVFNKYAWLCKYGAGPSPIEGMPNELSNPSPQPYVESPATKAMNANTMATSRQFQQNMKRQRDNYLLNRQHRQQSAMNAKSQPMPGRDYQLPSARNIRTRLYQENPNYQPYDPYKYDRATEQVDLDFNAVPPDPAQKQRDNYLLNSQRRQQSARNAQTQPMPGRDYALPAARNIRTRLYPENANYQAYNPSGNGRPVDLNLAAVPPDADQVRDMSYMNRTVQQLYQDAYANGELDQEAIDLYNQRYPDAPLGQNPSNGVPGFDPDVLLNQAHELISDVDPTASSSDPMEVARGVWGDDIVADNGAGSGSTYIPAQMNAGYANGYTAEPDYPPHSRYMMQGDSTVKTKKKTRRGAQGASKPYDAVPPGTRTVPEQASASRGRGRTQPVAAPNPQAGSSVAQSAAPASSFYDGLAPNQQALWNGYAAATQQTGKLPMSQADMDDARQHWTVWGQRPQQKKIYNANGYYGDQR